MTTAFQHFKHDVDFMWRETTSLATTQLIVKGQLTREQIAMLTLQMYHYVKFTTPVFKDALRLVPEGDDDHLPLRQMLAFFAKDEEGHDLVALRDLQALGYDPKACIKTLPLPTTLNLHGANKLAIEQYGPYYLVGETYATETVGAEMSAAIHKAIVSTRPDLKTGVHFYDLHGEADVVHSAKTVAVLEHILERKPETRRPILLGCLTAWRNLAQLAAEIFKAPLYPREFQLSPTCVE